MSTQNGCDEDDGLTPAQKRESARRMNALTDEQRDNMNNAPHGIPVTELFGPKSDSGLACRISKQFPLLYALKKDDAIREGLLADDRRILLPPKENI